MNSGQKTKFHRIGQMLVALLLASFAVSFEPTVEADPPHDHPTRAERLARRDRIRAQRALDREHPANAMPFGDRIQGPWSHFSPLDGESAERREQALTAVENGAAIGSAGLESLEDRMTPEQWQSLSLSSRYRKMEILRRELGEGFPPAYERVYGHLQRLLRRRHEAMVQRGTRRASSGDPVDRIGRQVRMMFRDRCQSDRIQRIDVNACSFIRLRYQIDLADQILNDEDQRLLRDWMATIPESPVPAECSDHEALWSAGQAQGRGSMHRGRFFPLHGPPTDLRMRCEDPATAALVAPPGADVSESVRNQRTQCCIRGFEAAWRAKYQSYREWKATEAPRVSNPCLESISAAETEVNNYCRPVDGQPAASVENSCPYFHFGARMMGCYALGYEFTRSQCPVVLSQAREAPRSQAAEADINPATDAPLRGPATGAPGAQSQH